MLSLKRRGVTFSLCRKGDMITGLQQHNLHNQPRCQPRLSAPLQKYRRRVPRVRHVTLTIATTSTNTESIKSHAHGAARRRPSRTNPHSARPRTTHARRGTRAPFVATLVPLL